jgi:hypothetical protein
MSFMSDTITTTDNSMAVPLERLGPPGVLAHLSVTPIFKDQKATDIERLQDRSLRAFHVTARLAKHVDTVPNINFNFTPESGDSLFVFPSDSVLLLFETGRGNFTLHPNAQKHLSSIRFECSAHTIQEAKRLFHRIVGPVLDQLAYKANSPLHLVQLTVFDVKHNISATDILCPHPDIMISPGIDVIREKLIPVLAMYREGVNSTSPYYKFFCLYKILEGLLKSFQADLRAQAMNKGLAIPPLDAKVPDHPDFSSAQKEFVGKSVHRLFEKYLTPRFRNSMAHFITNEGAVLNVNEVENLERYSEVVHITDLCVRAVITHFEKCIDILEKR